MIKVSFKNAKTCVFCKYWRGTRAKRSSQSHYWEYELTKGTCLKKKLTNVNSTHNCRDFVLYTIKYFDT